jgi:hypothetical protein
MMKRIQNTYSFSPYFSDNLIQEYEKDSDLLIRYNEGSWSAKVHMSVVSTIQFIEAIGCIVSSSFDGTVKVYLFFAYIYYFLSY